LTPCIAAARAALAFPRKAPSSCRPARQHPLGHPRENAIPSFPRKRESIPSISRLRRNRPEPSRPSWPPVWQHCVGRQGTDGFSPP